jgi:hypothetical protein
MSITKEYPHLLSEVLEYIKIYEEMQEIAVKILKYKDNSVPETEYNKLILSLDNCSNKIRNIKRICKLFSDAYNSLESLDNNAERLKKQLVDKKNRLSGDDIPV